MNTNRPKEQTDLVGGPYKKAAWPVGACRRIMNGLLAELQVRMTETAFPAELGIERNAEVGPIDAPDGDPEVPEQIPNTAGDETREVHDQTVEERVRMQSTSKETERHRIWLEFPREVRAAIRRLHTMVGHKPYEVMVHILRGASASPELVKAAKNSDAKHALNSRLTQGHDP